MEKGKFLVMAAALAWKRLCANGRVDEISAGQVRCSCVREHDGSRGVASPIHFLDRRPSNRRDTPMYLAPSRKLCAARGPAEKNDHVPAFGGIRSAFSRLWPSRSMAYGWLSL